MRLVSGNIVLRLQELLDAPGLTGARNLEHLLLASKLSSNVFGRRNQSASIEANAESDRGVAERLANAFDASLTAARLLSGLKSERSLTPRVAAQKFFAPDPQKCEWKPTAQNLERVKPPELQFWEESPTSKHRFRKYQPKDGLATVLVRDFGVGLSRQDMPGTILTLNSDAKLLTFEAIGRFGHGGSSSLFFCESALVMSMPHIGGSGDQVYWTLVYPEQDPEESKQDLLRKWFADEDGLPLALSLNDVPKAFRDGFPGTSIWHFGYHRGGWIRKIKSPDQSNPWGRLGRLFFSYPLPFTVRGEFAREDTAEPTRRITSPFSRLVEASTNKDSVQHYSREKTEKLIVENVEYGEFSVVAFVMVEPDNVRNYVDKRHPVILTLNGQNHGEMTRAILAEANLPELASSMIVEIRLDKLDSEALSNIVLNSREFPKPTIFTNTLISRLQELLRDDDAIQAIERERQERKAQESNKKLNESLSSFIKSILSDAVGAPAAQQGSEAQGEPGGRGEARPLVEPRDPPSILSFISSSMLAVPEGSTYLAKFKSDARPPKYSFGGDNPRLFVRYSPLTEFGARIKVLGQSEINDRGYGSISIHCCEDSAAPITTKVSAGTLHLTLQSVDGSVLAASLEVGVAPKPERKQRTRQQDVSVQVTFSAPGGDKDGSLGALILEDHVGDFGGSLQRFKDGLQEISDVECTYWGEKYEKEGKSVLAVEINVANPSLVNLLKSCASLEERVLVKDRYCRDVVLDCYQHCFRLDSVPDGVWKVVQSLGEDSVKASEMFLNHEKALRFAARERSASRKTNA